MKTKFKRKQLHSDDKKSSYLLNINTSWELETNLFSSFSSKCKCSMNTNSEVEIVQLDDIEETHCKNETKNGNRCCNERRILFIPVIDEDGSVDQSLMQNPNIMTSMESLDVLNSDIKEQIDKTRNASSDDTGVIACTEFNKTFPHRQGLHNNLLLTRTEDPCTDCEKKFSRKHNLKKHSECTHENVLVSCQTKNLFLNEKEEEPDEKNSLFSIEPMIEQKKKKKTFSCDICHENLFQNKKEVMEHKSSCHTDDKPYVCDKCDKKFARKYSLKRHSLIHSGDST